MAYAELEPFGPIQEDYRAAVTACLVYNANRKPGAAPKQPAEFFESLKKLKREAVNPALQLARAQAMAMQAGR